MTFILPLLVRALLGNEGKICETIAKFGGDFPSVIADAGLCHRQSERPTKSDYGP